MNYCAANLEGVGNCWKISFTVARVAKIEGAWLIRKRLTFYLQTEQLFVVGKGVW